MASASQPVRVKARDRAEMVATNFRLPQGWPSALIPGQDKAVRWQRQKRAYCLNHVALRGIKPTQANLFYPKYSYKAAKFGAKRMIPASRQHHDSKHDKMMGMELGGYVDREVGRLCNVLSACRQELTLAQFLNHNIPLPLTISQGHFVELQRARQHMHLYTHSVLLTLLREDLQPVAADVACGSGHARLGTAVDIVAVRASAPNLLVLIELKCGFMNYLHKYQGKMEPPYSHFTDCPLHQFYLQLALTEVLFRRTYPRARLGLPLVINVHAGSCDVYPLPRRVQALNRDAWQRLLETKTKTATQRRKQTKKRQRQAALELDAWERNAKSEAVVVPAQERRAALGSYKKRGYRPYANSSRASGKARAPNPW